MHVYERILDVMRALQKHELASEQQARAAQFGSAGPRRGRWSARDRE